MQNTIKILVDLKKEIYRFDQAQQGDDVILDLTIIENGVHKDLTGETVELLYINANNTVASVTGDKIIVSGNNVKITCPTDCTRSYGIAKFQLKIVSTYQVSTFPIALTIVPSVDQNQQISQNISTILEDLTAKNIECGETLESLKTWISTGNLLNADLESNIGTGTLLNTDLEDNITTVTQLKTVLSNVINTGNELDTSLEGKISVGNTLDATLKADTETANTAKINLQNAIATADTTTYATQGQVTEINSHLAEKANYRQENNIICPNMVAGYDGNDVNSDVYSATIAGGGSLGRENIIGGSTTNVGTTTPNMADLSSTGANFAVIGGGYDNVNNGLASILTGMHCLIEKEATHGTISGGSFHKITTGDYGTIGGGTQNEVSAISATVGGGTTNKASGITSFVGGGNTNQATGLQATTVGGSQNIASGQGSFIGGGTLNKATNLNSFVGGGTQNEANGDTSVVSGGYKNKVITGTGSVINGGSENSVNGNFATIDGGYQNQANGSGSSVTGGHNNIASNIDSSILGGKSNTNSADYSAILGGQGNISNGKYSTVQGLDGKSTYAVQKVQGIGKFLNVGDAQLSSVGLKIKTNDATQTSLFTTDGISPTLQINESIAFTVTIIARRTDVIGEQKYFEIKGMAYKNGTGNVTITTTTPVTLGTPTWSVDLVGGSTTFNVKVTGEIGKTIQWVAKVEFVENIG